MSRKQSIFSESSINSGILEKRTRKVSVDEETLLKYDQFYKTTKSLLVLFQIMGVMPIMRTSPGRTTFYWTSKATVYAYFLFTIETIYVTIIFKERLNIMLEPGKRFDEYIYNIIFLSILIPHFLVPIASWRGGPEVAKFKNMWTHFQVRYLRLCGEPLMFPSLTVITWSLCIFSWVLGIVIMGAEFLLQPDLLWWHTLAFYHVFATLNGLCALWYVNCTAMGGACRGMAKSLKIALEGPDPSVKLAEYRHLWGDLSHMMQQLGKAYSNMYGMYCIVILFTTITASYGCLAEILDHGFSEKLSGLILIVFYCMGILYTICNEAYHASRRVRMLFQDRLLCINLSIVDKRTRQEIDLFLTSIQKNPPIMNLNQYLNIDRELITTTVKNIVTYLVVLMQIKLTLLRSTKSKTDK
ncbi:gustatory and odorant receptor 22 [Chrysoperla carnea]|uniref:gustatory and odorant receptor 22 n=1 Tax=Chrysoperla carnea TaxID=189513 RepID=UPI001D08C127|nr:gustatory and odorant receptor 22 [Chrysoperla carnea]